MTGMEFHHFKLFRCQAAGFVQYFVGCEDFAKVVEKCAHNGLMQDIGGQATMVSEQGHQHTQIYRVFQKIIVLFPDAPQAA